jgi:hypothetical protein
MGPREGQGGVPPAHPHQRRGRAVVAADTETGGSTVKKEFIVQRKDDKGNAKDFVLYAGLLDLAHERGLKAITTTLVQAPSELNGSTAICHATVQLEAGTFSGIGDANPGNVTRMMVPHLIRMAETRAKARALRDAVNIGTASLEELGDDDKADHGGQWPTNGAATSATPVTAPTGAVARAGASPARAPGPA